MTIREIAMTKKALCAFLLLFLVGCASTHVPKHGAGARTAVTVQRRPSKAYADRIMQVFVDDAAIPYSLENGGAITFSVVSGMHYIYVKIGDAKSDMVNFTAAQRALALSVSVEKGLFRKPTIIIAKSVAEGDTAAVAPHDDGGAAADRAASGGKADEKKAATASGGIDKALNRAAEAVMKSTQKKLKLAITNVSASDRFKNLSVLAADKIELLLVNNGYTVVDRSELDRIRDEQKFQLSGAVDDSQIVSIGKFAGADVIITGAISESGGVKTLRLRALSVETARVLASVSERF
jgi:hypothetical protein